jgi:hypothetical protein
LSSIQGINSESSRFRLLLGKIRPKNVREFSNLRASGSGIPCAPEQGINSSTTGNAVRENSELNRPNREVSILDPRPIQLPEDFSVPALLNLGAKGWVGMRLDDTRDWNEVAAFVKRSYRLVAPKRLAAIE